MRALRIGFEVEMTEVQVLVQVTAHQPLLVRVAVEECFPNLNLLLDVRRQRLITFERRTGCDPPRDRRELALVEAGQAVRHAGERIFLGEGIELFDARTRQRAAPSDTSNALESSGEAGSG